MDDILKDVVRNGTGTGAAIAISSGGKTGTTTDSRDLWYIGYTRELATAIWAGNSDGTVVTGYSTYGGTISAPIWRDFMNTLYYSGVFYEKPAPVEEPIEEEPAEDEEITPEEELPDDEVEPLPGEDETDRGEEVLPPGPGDEQNSVIPETTDIYSKQKKDTRLPDLPQ